MPVAYLALVASVGFIALHYERSYRARLAKVPDLNAYLASTDVPEPVHDPLPLTDTDRELVRWAFELSLQPVDRFEGFEVRRALTRS